MSAVWVALIAAAPSPSPTPTQGPDELQVTPGLAGFVATFAVALACVLLFLSLTRHLRRARHNAEEQGIPIEEPEPLGLRRPGEGGGAAPTPGEPGDRGGPGGTDGGDGTDDETGASRDGR